MMPNALRVLIRDGALSVGDWRFPCVWDHDAQTYEILLYTQHPATTEILRALVDAMRICEYSSDLYDDLTVVNFMPYASAIPTHPFIDPDGNVRFGESANPGEIQVRHYEPLKDKVAEAGYANAEIQIYGVRSFGVMIKGDFRDATKHKRKLDAADIPTSGFYFKDDHILILVNFNGR